MAGEPVDLKLTDTGDYFDITIDSDGDFSTTDGLNTSLTVSFFTDRRADESEVTSPQYRRGWFGNLFNDTDEPELGSKIWLLDQTPLTTNAVNNAIAYARDAYSWLTDLGFADRVDVTASSTIDSIFITITVIKNNDIITQKVYNLWVNTVSEINA